jgi:hypothetical protein
MKKRLKMFNAKRTEEARRDRREEKAEKPNTEGTESGHGEHGEEKAGRFTGFAEDTQQKPRNHDP